MTRWIRPVLAAPIILGVLAPFGAVALAQPLRTSPSEVLGNPRVFDGKVVTLSGTVVNLQERVADGGKRFYTFDLSDGAEAVHVLSAGRSRCATGRATVDGTFDGARQLLTAARIRCR